MRKRYVLTTLILMLLVAACGPAQTDEETAAAEEPTPTEQVGQEESVAGGASENAGASAPSGPPAEFANEEYTTTDSGLQIAVTDEGSGEQPQEGDVVSVHYTGMLGDGTVFDSSSNRGEPFSFPLGRGRVIQGWDEGIALLQQGGKAKLIIPPELGYGEQGSGGVIPPNATLYFDVELVDIQPGGPSEPVEVDAEELVETDSGLRYFVMEEGSGESPEEGQPVRMHYTIWLEDGTRLDSSLDTGEPVAFAVGSEQVFPGWNAAVREMRVGDKWQVVVPPDLALGEEGAGDVIPPNSTLILQLDLLEILARGPDDPTAVDEDEYTVTDSGLKIATLEDGSGEAVAEGDVAVVHYTGWLEDGTRFDSSYQRGEPFRVTVGAGQVIPGWDEGLLDMKVGERRQLVIPPDLAYGEEGAGSVIPENATLTFELELLEIGEGQN